MLQLHVIFHFGFVVLFSSLWFYMQLIIYFQAAMKGVSPKFIFCSLQTIKFEPGSSVRVKITLIIIRLLAGLVMVLIEQISTTNI